MPDATTSEEGLANRNAIEELKSGAFVQNVQMLRGLGSLSNAEGSKLENLIARLDVTQPEDVVRKQLSEIRSQYSVLQRWQAAKLSPWATARRVTIPMCQKGKRNESNQVGNSRRPRREGFQRGATATNQKTGQK